MNMCNFFRNSKFKVQILYTTYKESLLLLENHLIKKVALKSFQCDSCLYIYVYIKNVINTNYLTIDDLFLLCKKDSQGILGLDILGLGLGLLDD